MIILLLVVHQEVIVSTNCFSRKGFRLIAQKVLALRARFCLKTALPTQTRFADCIAIAAGFPNAKEGRTNASTSFDG
jgi:hypothetical protein